MANSKFHVGEDGIARKCIASKRPCKYGESVHGNTPEEAMRNYENSQAGKMQELLAGFDPTAFQREVFFSLGDGNLSEGNYFIIHTSTGTVIGDSCYVLDADNFATEEELEEFYENPADFIDDDSVPITQARNLSSFSTPIIVSSAGDVIDCENVYVLNAGDPIIDFDEILESQRAAKNTAEEFGFKLWD